MFGESGKLEEKVGGGGVLMNGAGREELRKGRRSLLKEVCPSLDKGELSLIGLIIHSVLGNYWSLYWDTEYNPTSRTKVFGSFDNSCRYCSSVQ